MAALNPVIDPNIQHEQPVVSQANNSGSTLFQGLSAALGTLNNQPAAAPTVRELDNGLNSALVRGLSVAQGLRDQGREREALTMERRVTTNFAVAGGDLGSADTKALIENFTGQPIDFVGFSAEEVAMRNAMQTPEFQNYYIGSFSDPAMATASDEERVSFAINRISRAQGNAALIEESQQLWTNQSEGAYMATISDFMDTNLGALVVADQQGESITLEGLQESRAQWELTKSTVLRRPPNVTTEQWAAIKGQTDTIDSTLDYLEKMAGNDNISARLADNMVRAIQTVAQNEGRPLNAGENIVLQMVLRHDTQSLLALSEQGTTFSEAITAAEGLGSVTSARISLGFNQVSGALADPNDPNSGLNTTNGWDPVVFDNAKGADPSESLNIASGLMSLNIGTSPAVLTDPSYQEQWGITMSSGLAALYHVTDQENWVTEGKYRELLSPELFANLDAMKSVNPVLYEALRGNAFAAIDKNRASLLANLSQRESGEVFQYDPNEGRFVATMNGVLSSNLISNSIKEDLVTLVNTQYGGDINAAFNDATFNATSLGGTDITLGKIKEIFKPTKEVLQQASALRFLNEQALRVAPTPTTIQTQGAGGVTGSLQGTPVLTNTSMSPIINTTEGASHMVHEGAVNRLDAVISGPFQRAQELFGASLMVNDALAKEGTSRESDTPNSRHFHGDALDISTSGMSNADKTRLVSALQEAGFQGLGFGNNIIHADMGNRRAWAYGNTTFGGVSVSELISAHNAGTTPPPEMGHNHSPTNNPESDDHEGEATQFVSTSNVTSGFIPPVAPVAAPVQRPASISANVPEGTKEFSTEEEAQAALDRGDISLGEIILIDGKPVRVEDDG